MRTIAACSLTLALAGCGLLTAEAEADRVCVTQETDATVPPYAGPDTDQLPPAFFDLLPSFAIDLGAALPDLEEEGIEADFSPEGITLHSTTDLSGISRLVLVAVPVGGAATEPVRFRYERPAGAAAPLHAITAVPEHAVDLVDYLNAEQLTVRFEDLAGRPPASAWTPSLEICGATKVEIDYGERI